MIIYLLVRIRSIFIDGYEIGCEKDILNAYSTKEKALTAKWEHDDEEDPTINYRIVEIKVI